MIYTSMRKFIVDTYDWWNCLFASPSPRALTQNVEKWGERGGWVVAIKLKLTTLAKIMFKVFFIANKIQSWIGDSDTSLKFSTLLHSSANLGFWRCSTLCFNKIGGVGPMCGRRGHLESMPHILYTYTLHNVQLMAEMFQLDVCSAS